MGKTSTAAQGEPTSQRPVKPPTRHYEPTFVHSFGVLLIGGLLGAAIGGVVFARMSNYSVSALVQAAPVALGGVEQDTSATPYVRAELVYAENDSAEMAVAVAEETGITDPPPVTILLQTGTTILEFRASGSTAGDAVAVSNASVDFYVTRWRERTLDALESSVQILDGQLAGLPDGSAGALALAAEKTEIETEIASVRVADRIISEATTSSAVQTASPMGGVILGGLAGAVLAGLVLIGMHRARMRAAPVT